jgi:hypothetical protein
VVAPLASIALPKRNLTEPSFLTDASTDSNGLLAVFRAKSVCATLRTEPAIIANTKIKKFKRINKTPHLLPASYLIFN